MPDATINLLLAIIAGLFGAGGIVAWFRARTERLQWREQADAAHDEIVRDAHRVTADTVVTAFKELSEAQRRRLAEYDVQLAALDARLSRERELRDALEERSVLLERKVEALERERDSLNAKIASMERERAEWRREREHLRQRIVELEGCK